MKDAFTGQELMGSGEAAVICYWLLRGVAAVICYLGARCTRRYWLLVTRYLGEALRKFDGLTV